MEAEQHREGMMTPGKEPAQPTPGTDEGEVYIEYTRLDEIHRDPQNPKDHDLGALGQSFKRFGYVLPMAVNENTGLLMAGHGRLDQLEAMRIGGMEPPTRIKTDDQDGMWLAPVIRGIRMSPEDGKAYVIADNRLVELGGWNEPMLVERLIEIAGGDAEQMLLGTGFDAEDLDRMIALIGGKTDHFDAGDLPDAPAVEGANTKAYIVAVVFVSFKEESTFERGLGALTFGERAVQREASRYAQIDGEKYLERWETLMSGQPAGEG
jgi:hypothetical protein